MERTPVCARQWSAPPFKVVPVVLATMENAESMTTATALAPVVRCPLVQYRLCLQHDNPVSAFVWIDAQMSCHLRDTRDRLRMLQREASERYSGHGLPYTLVHD